MKDSSTKLYKLVTGFLAVCFWIGIWSLASGLLNKELILPSPLGAATALWEMLFTGTFYANVLATMYRVISGIVLSLVAGFLSALLAYYIEPVRVLLKPLVSVIKATPVMAVIIVALLWLTSGNVPIFVCFLICYPVIYTNVLTGLDSMNKSYLEMAKVYKIPIAKQAVRIYVPSVMPYLKSALSLVCGLSWKTVVTAEVLSIPKFSMGYQLLDSKIYLNTDQTFAWIISIVTLSIFFEMIMKYIISGRALKRIKRGGKK